MKKRLQSARENVKITLERFRLNQSNALEIRQAQKCLEDALYNLILANYNAKLPKLN